MIERNFACPFLLLLCFGSTFFVLFRHQSAWLNSHISCLICGSLGTFVQGEFFSGHRLPPTVWPLLHRCPGLQQPSPLPAASHRHLPVSLDLLLPPDACPTLFPPPLPPNLSRLSSIA